MEGDLVIICRGSIIIGFILYLSACSQSKMILRDMARDIYEKHRNEQLIECLDKAPGRIKDPLPYDRYQNERQEFISNHEN